MENFVESGVFKFSRNQLYQNINYINVILYQTVAVRNSVVCHVALLSTEKLAVLLVLINTRHVCTVQYFVCVSIAYQHLNPHRVSFYSI